jgi:lipase
VRLHVHEWGDPEAPPLVCLHGVTGHGRRFRRLAEERLAARFHVVAPDLRGHGRSAYDEPWTLAAHVKDILETVAGRAAAWLGHSFGGRLVMEIAAREPGLVERAILLDPAIHVPTEFALYFAAQEQEDRSWASVEEAIAARVESGGLVSTPQAILEEEMREHLVRSPDGRYRYRYSPSAVVAAYLAMTADPPPFERLRLPTLLVVGELSKFVGAGEAEQYRRALGDLVELVAVPGGHMVYWDAFDESAAAIEAFLAR